MNKIFKYLKDNGIKETFKRIFKRVFNLIGITTSATYFLSFNSKQKFKNESSLPDYKIKKLDINFLEKFNAMKYYNFLNAEEIIKSKNSSIFVALEKDEIVGYICCHNNIDHKIHSLGTWKLNKEESWIGPTYVKKSYRNKKVHRLLLVKATEAMIDSGISVFYTAINKDNIASIKSFNKAGFSIIGLVKIRKFINKIIYFKVEELNEGLLVSTKFKGIK